MTSAWGLSLFGVFNSPNTFGPNEALTYNEIDGMKWLYESRNDLNISAPLSQLYRFHDLLDDGSIDHNIVIPDHFGYNSTQTKFSDAVLKEGQRTYLVLNSYDELLYQDVPGYSNVGRYTHEDFSRFRSDPTVDKIYAGLNSEVYYSERAFSNNV